MSTEQLPIEATKAAADVEAYLKMIRREPIENHDQYVDAADMLKQVKAKLEEVEEKRLSITRPMDVAKQRIMDFFRLPTNKLKEAEKALKDSMIAWQAEVAKLAAIEQAKVDAALAAAAEAEKAKLEAQAVKLVEQGKVGQAADLIAKSEDIVPVEMTLKVVQPRVAEIRTFETWGYEIVDLSLVPREWLCLDEKKIGAHARSTKGMVPVAGIRFISKKGIAA